MPGKKSTFVDHVVHELLAGIDGITSRAMFGGHGVYKGGIIFAIIVNDELYFKVDGSNKGEYEARSSHPFVYSQGGHAATTMSYWLVPDEVLDDPDLLASWVDVSVGISKANKSNASKKKPTTMHD
jgi:DNA transformation protein